ncbi:MAG TPA: hypothetical protein VHW90_05205 [Stellaceae bacterium]|jgi:hypothetical protein|nr:hypothetical protein [Stellaceae bacterium]
MSDDNFTWRLLADERLIWSGQPRQGVMLTGRDALLIPFSLTWGGFAIFWEATVLSSSKAPAFFILWGVPFVVVGLYLIAGRFLVDAWLRGKTHYALTNQRILISRGGPGSRLSAFSLERLPELQLNLRSDGSGTISLSQSAIAWRNFSVWMPAIDMTQLVGIPNAQQVFDQIQRTARQASREGMSRDGGADAA